MAHFKTCTRRVEREFTVLGPRWFLSGSAFQGSCRVWTKKGNEWGPHGHWLVSADVGPRRFPALVCVEGLAPRVAMGGAACTHLWVRGPPALRWGHDIPGAPERRGGQWSRGAPGGRGAPRGRADRWIPALRASAGELPAAPFALWERRGASVRARHGRPCSGPFSSDRTDRGGAVAWGS